MPANLPIEYFKLEREYWKSSDRKEKIKILHQMIAVIPKHKGTERLIGEIRRRISKINESIKKEEKRKRSKRKIGIRKEGAGQVCLVGFPNSGKSYLMNILCNKNLKSTSIPFETKKPEIGMMDYKGIKVQLIEIPSVYNGFKEKRKMLIGIIRNSDVVAIVGNKKAEKEIEASKTIYINSKEKIKNIKDKIWYSLNKIIVYTKEPDKKEGEPLAMDLNSTIKDLGKEIHKDFITRFKYAKVIHKKRIKRVGLKYKLEDGDIVEFHLR